MNSRSVSAGQTRVPAWRKFLTTQRVIIVTFALVEAAVIGWAIVHTLLRDALR